MTTPSPDAPRPSRPLDALLAIALEAARTGGAILMERYARPHDIVHKGRVNLVTEADPASEAAIRALLTERAPEIPIMAEETEASHDLPRDQTLWLIDPLDGTTSFAHGFPMFAVSVACLSGGRPLVGVVYAPLLNECFTAVRGGGAFLNGRPIHVSTVREPVAALVATGFPYERMDCLETLLRRLSRVLTTFQDVRRGGSAALDLSYVACGRLDGYYETRLKPWDSAAGWLMVLEAGGRVTGMDGGEYSPFLPHLLATNGALHEELLRLMRHGGEE